MSIKKTLLNAAMPTLKSLVNAVLTAWRGSHKSVPRTSYIVQNVTVTGGYANRKEVYTAPNDGLFVAQAGLPCTYLAGRRGASVDVSSTSWGSADSYYPCISYPLAKGDTVTLVASSTNNASFTVYMRFYPYVGS